MVVRVFPDFWLFPYVVNTPTFAGVETGLYSHKLLPFNELSALWSLKGPRSFINALLLFELYVFISMGLQRYKYISKLNYIFIIYNFFKSPFTLYWDNIYRNIIIRKSISKYFTINFKMTFAKN